MKVNTLWKIPLFLLIVFTIQSQFITSYRVEGLSMYPTLNTDDRMFISKKINNINRFDIVLFKRDEEIYVKRIIGLPNEQVEYRNNTLYINGHEVRTDHLTIEGTMENHSWTTQDKKYVVLGDNRLNSVDSRQFGMILENEIIGKVSMVYFPIKKWKMFNDNNIK